MPQTMASMPIHRLIDSAATPGKLIINQPATSQNTPPSTCSQRGAAASAAERLTYLDDIALLEQFREQRRTTSVLVVLRHAKAPPADRRRPVEAEFNPTLKLIGGAQKADDAELSENPRARSAVLRVAEKVQAVHP